MAMRLLLDECTPVGFRRILAGFLPPGSCVDHVATLGWQGVTNGRLLGRMAEHRYLGLVTTDRNLAAQQAVTETSIFVVVLVARTNRLTELAPLADRAARSCLTAVPGQVITIR
jgi:hypothetical protein